MNDAQQEAARRAEVMLAFSRGEVVESSRHCDLGSAPWIPRPDPSWNWEVCDYRVKPTPIELRVVLAYDNSGTLINSRVIGFLNADEVHRRLVPGGPELVLTVREVTDGS